MNENTPMRKTPRQQRSQQRVNTIIEAAAMVFAENGIEAATTNQIAARAGVPIGSLYQFFPNKEALIEALTERYLGELHEIYERLLTPEKNMHLSTPQVIWQLLTGIAAFKGSHPAFDPLFMNPESAQQMGTSKQEIHSEIVTYVENMLRVRLPMLTADQHHLAAVVGVGIVKGLMPLGDAPYFMPPQQLLTEMVAAVVAYLRDFLLRNGYPLPDDLKM